MEVLRDAYSCIQTLCTIICIKYSYSEIFISWSLKGLDCMTNYLEVIVNKNVILLNNCHVISAKSIRYGGGGGYQI